MLPENFSLVFRVERDNKTYLNQSLAIIDFALMHFVNIRPVN